MDARVEPSVPVVQEMSQQWRVPCGRDLEVVVVPRDDSVVMGLRGIVSQACLPLLGAAVELVLERRPPSLVVDCGEVDVPATSQLAALVDIVERSHERGVPCSLARLTRLQVLLLRRWWPQVDPSAFEEASARELTEVLLGHGLLSGAAGG